MLTQFAERAPPRALQPAATQEPGDTLCEAPARGAGGLSRALGRLPLPAVALFAAIVSPYLAFSPDTSGRLLLKT